MFWIVDTFSCFLTLAFQCQSKSNYVSRLPASHYCSCCSWLCVLYISSCFSSSAATRTKKSTASCRARLLLCRAGIITDWMYCNMYLAYQWLQNHCHCINNMGKSSSLRENVAPVANYSFPFYFH